MKNKRIGALKLITEEDAMNTKFPEPQCDSSEVGYRRGFRQGYSFALDDVRYTKTTWAGLYKFFNKKIMPWSYFIDKKKSYFPPRLVQSKGDKS